MMYFFVILLFYMVLMLINVEISMFLKHEPKIAYLSDFIWYGR